MLERVKRAVRTGAYRLTSHAEIEREAEAIFMAETEDAFGAETLELLEEYPNDPRGFSGLYLGFTASGSLIHAVVGLSNPDTIVFVTLYRPDDAQWYHWRRRV